MTKILIHEVEQETLDEKADQLVNLLGMMTSDMNIDRGRRRNAVIRT